MTFIPELIIPRHERILSSPKLDNSFEIVNARDEPRNDASPLFLPAPPLVVPIRWNSTLPLAFTSTLVFYRPNKAEQTTTQTRRTTTARAKRTGGIGYAVIDTRDHRTLRGRKRCATPPPSLPLLPSPVDELAALSWNRWRLLALFFTGFTCAIPRTRNTILLYSGSARDSRVGQFQGDDFLKRTSDCWELKSGWWIIEDRDKKKIGKH